MKIDSMTLGAVGFAAFAAWFVLKPKTAGAAPVNGLFGAAKSQRQQVGDALGLNTDYLNTWDVSNASMGGGQGLKPPSVGFWS